MYNMTIELKDNGILRRLQQAPQSVVNPAMNKFMSKASLMVVQRAKEKAPRAQGTLSGSINASPVEKIAVGYRTSVGTNVEYAPHQEYGTGIYGKNHRPITPRKKRVLAWKGGKYGPGWHVARQVRGVRPKKFMKAGVEYLQSRQQGLVNELAAEIKRGIEG